MHDTGCQLPSKIDRAGPIDRETGEIERLTESIMSGFQAIGAHRMPVMQKMRFISEFDVFMDKIDDFSLLMQYNVPFIVLQSLLESDTVNNFSFCASLLERMFECRNFSSKFLWQTFNEIPVYEILARACMDNIGDVINPGLYPHVRKKLCMLYSHAIGRDFDGFLDRGSNHGDVLNFLCYFYTNIEPTAQTLSRISDIVMSIPVDTLVPLRCILDLEGTRHRENLFVPICSMITKLVQKSEKHYNMVQEIVNFDIIPVLLSQVNTDPACSLLELAATLFRFMPGDDAARFARAIDWSHVFGLVEKCCSEDYNFCIIKFVLKLVRSVPAGLLGTMDLASVMHCVDDVLLQRYGLFRGGTAKIREYTFRLFCLLISSVLHRADASFECVEASIAMVLQSARFVCDLSSKTSFEYLKVLSLCIDRVSENSFLVIKLDKESWIEFSMQFAEWMRSGMNCDDHAEMCELMESLIGRFVEFEGTGSFDFWTRVHLTLGSHFSVISLQSAYQGDPVLILDDSN